MVAKFATATFLTRHCSEKFTIQRKKLSIAKNSAWPGIAPCWLRTFFSSAKISSNFHHHQIFSAGYSSRLYMYIGIYNRYGCYRPLNRSAKIMPPRRTFQIISANVRECPFWFRSFPRNVRMNGR